MQVYASYAKIDASGTRQPRLYIVLFRTQFMAEIEKDRMKFSNASRVGVSTRPATPREIVKRLKQRFPMATVTLRREVPGYTFSLKKGA